MSTAQTTTLKIKLSLASEGVHHIAEAMRAPNSASPTIDPYEAAQFVQRWAAVAPTSRSWLDTPAGIVITHNRDGEYAPSMQLWPRLADGLMPVHDCPIDDTVVTTYERVQSDEEVLDLIASQLLAAQTGTPVDLGSLLESIAYSIGGTGRAV